MECIPDPNLFPAAMEVYRTVLVNEVSSSLCTEVMSLGTRPEWGVQGQTNGANLGCGWGRTCVR
jgi:hypothetical protein